MNIFSESIFILTIISWVLLFIQSHRMFYLFRKKYPEIAKKEITSAFESYQSPDKFFFFFRKKNKQLLKDDKEVWRLREQTKILLIFSLGLPILLVFVALISVGFL